MKYFQKRTHRLKWLKIDLCIFAYSPLPSKIISKVILKSAVLVFWGCCNTLPHAGWLTATEMCFLTVLGTSSPKSRSLQSQALKAPWKDRFRPLSWPGRASGVPQLVDASFRSPGSPLHVCLTLFSLCVCMSFCPNDSIF